MGDSVINWRGCKPQIWGQGEYVGTVKAPENIHVNVEYGHVVIPLFLLKEWLACVPRGTRIPPGFPQKRQ